MTKTDTDDESHEEAQHDDRQPFFAVCRDCEFVDAVRADGKEAIAMEDGVTDPARVHYEKTGHTVTTQAADGIADKIDREALFNGVTT
jgi:hypothetical protein